MIRQWATRLGGLSAMTGASALVAKYVGLPMQTDGTWWAQVAAAIVGGGGTIAAAQFRTVKKAVGLSVVPEIEAAQQRDLEAVNHLVERFRDANTEAADAKWSAAIESLRQLQSGPLFDLHYLALAPVPIQSIPQQSQQPAQPQQPSTLPPSGFNPQPLFDWLTKVLSAPSPPPTPKTGA